jgi:thioredoxin reductase (NADPH)
MKTIRLVNECIGDFARIENPFLATSAFVVTYLITAGSIWLTWIWSLGIRESASGWDLRRSRKVRFQPDPIVHCIRAFCDYGPTLEWGHALSEEIPTAMTDNGESKTSAWNTPDFRPDLAFPKLTEEMVERLGSYGREETVPANVPLFTHGERQVDLFVVLDGEVDVSLPTANGESKIIAHHQRFDFSGELNLLTSQGSLVEARTVKESHLLRIPRSELQKLMRAEGDIANLITSATIWRRIGILGEETSGVVLMGHANDAETTELQRFLIRNNYPYRIVEVPADEVSLPDDDLSDHESTLPAVILSDSRTLHRPTITQLADELGITELPDPEMIYDVTVVGAGPSGLAAAVYAASEGLCTIVIESTAPGGQAGTSSKIENYLGFPTGISGQRLASRAQLQALKFGVRFAISRETITAE